MIIDLISGNFMKIFSALEQISFLTYEIKKIVNKKYWRWFTIWFNPGFGIILSYRLERLFFFLFGKLWTILRVLFLFPLLFRILYGSSEIHYRAKIGKGMLIRHPSLGVVISGKAIIGENLNLVGGNCIGFRDASEDEKLVIGNNVKLGANAVILGPVMVGDHVNVGAGAVVVSNVKSGQTVVGIPAKRL